MLTIKLFNRGVQVFRLKSFIFSDMNIFNLFGFRSNSKIIIGRVTPKGKKATHTPLTSEPRILS